MKHVLRRTLLACSILCTLQRDPSGQGAVHVIDAAGAPGSGHTTFASALAAAADGDVLLVRPGTYGERVPLGTRSLSLVAEPGGLVQVLGFDVQGLAADRGLLVRGFLTNDPSAPAVTLANSLGPVWFEDCLFRALDFPGNRSGGLHANDSASLVLTRCTLEAAVVETGLAGATLSFARGRLTLHDTTVVGPPDTGAALALEAAHLELTGSRVLGGDGFDGIALFCTGQDGGTGLRAGAASSVVRRDSVLLGGDGGLGFGICADGADGPALEAPPGIVSDRPGTARHLELTSPVRAAAPLEARLSGLPGDLVWILHSRRPSPGLATGFLEGELLLAGTLQVVFFGPLDPGGVGLRTYPAPNPPPGLGAEVFLSQALFREAGGGTFHLSGPSGVTLLDAAF